MSAFWERFPDLAAQETRVISLPYPQGGLPAGSFGFLELYCDDPGCDCRRVLLQVRSEDEPEKVLATINYGWESESFYTKWLHGDRRGAREIMEASLDPLNVQSRFAPSFLRLFQSVVLQDKTYVQRLKRHYTMFKQQESPPGGSKDSTLPNSGDE
jgi:hypothetical protein